VSAAALPARGALRATWPWLAAAGGAVLLWWLRDARLTRDLLDWLPYLASGFVMNVVISVLAMVLGTLGGGVLGAMELSATRLVRAPAVAYVQVFRNAPHLVLIFATTYIFPFEVVVAGNYLPFPDWLKAVLGLAIPAAAYVAEIVRGAILSVPTTQWDAAKGIGLSRGQTLRWIILPQCLRRALPPWMNLYASITMSTALASLVGVHELLHAATDASTAVRRDDFTVAIYLTVLLAFFLFCYPISRLTRRLERRLAPR
jgi:polar amino acid transport system permease protein